MPVRVSARGLPLDRGMLNGVIGDVLRIGKVLVGSFIGFGMK